MSEVELIEDKKYYIYKSIFSDTYSIAVGSSLSNRIKNNPEDFDEIIPLEDAIRSTELQAENEQYKKWLDRSLGCANGFLERNTKSIIDAICLIGWERDKLKAENELLRNENKILVERVAELLVYTLKGNTP